MAAWIGAAEGERNGAAVGRGSSNRGTPRSYHPAYLINGTGNVRLFGAVEKQRERKRPLLQAHKSCSRVQAASEWNQGCMGWF